MTVLTLLWCFDISLILRKERFKCTLLIIFNKNHRSTLILVIMITMIILIHMQITNTTKRYPQSV